LLVTRTQSWGEGEEEGEYRFPPRGGGKVVSGIEQEEEEPVGKRRISHDFSKGGYVLKKGDYSQERIDAVQRRGERRA